MLSRSGVELFGCRAVLGRLIVEQLRGDNVGDILGNLLSCSGKLKVELFWGD